MLEVNLVDNRLEFPYKCKIAKFSKSGSFLCFSYEDRGSIDVLENDQENFYIIGFKDNLYIINKNTKKDHYTGLCYASKRKTLVVIDKIVYCAGRESNVIHSLDYFSSIRMQSCNYNEYSFIATDGTKLYFYNDFKIYVLSKNHTEKFVVDYCFELSMTKLSTKLTKKSKAKSERKRKYQCMAIDDENIYLINSVGQIDVFAK